MTCAHNFVQLFNTEVIFICFPFDHQGLLFFGPPPTKTWPILFWLLHSVQAYHNILSFLFIMMVNVSSFHTFETK